MDYQNLRGVFLHTINPDASKRKHAEDTLRALETQENFVLSLPETFMTDEDVTVRKIAIIFFKNSVSKNWKAESFKKNIMANIASQMGRADKTVFVYYKEILRFIFDNESAEELGDILGEVPAYMSSEDAKNNHVAISILLLIQGNDILRYNKGTIYPLVESIGQALLDKLLGSLKKEDYLLARLVMKYVAKMSKQYNMPSFFLDFNIYTTLFQTSKSILNLPNETEDLVKLKKWALRFLYKATHKALKKFHKDASVTELISQQSTITEMYGLCRNIIYLNACDQLNYEKITISAVEYVFLLLDEKEYFPLIMDDTSFYLTSLVLRTHMFTDKVAMEFEDFPDNYLRHKYSYYSNDLKTVSGSFFTALVKKLRKHPSYFDGVFNYLVSVIANTKKSPTPENASLCYGSIYLISLIAHQITNVKKGEVGDFLIDHILPFLGSQYDYLQSQTCYVLQFFDGNEATKPYSRLWTVSMLF